MVTFRTSQWRTIVLNPCLCSRFKLDNITFSEVRLRYSDFKRSEVNTDVGSRSSICSDCYWVSKITHQPPFVLRITYILKLVGNFAFSDTTRTLGQILKIKL